MRGQRRFLAIVVVVGAALGVVIAGVPSRHRDQPLRAAHPRTTTTTVAKPHSHP